MSDITLSKDEWESLKKDKERLDFLEECHTKLNEKYGTDYGWEVIINHNVVRMMMRCPSGLREIDLNDAKGGNDKIQTCRKAIDKKIEEFERMKKKLISLEDHNNRKYETVFPQQYPMLNGIACPKCGKEMYDTDGDVLCSIPPKKNIHCEACGHRDYAFL